jgi:glycosyltransferase involved in cell wall biosynthesis
MRSLAVVLPRYGASLGGGAETLTKELIEHLEGLSRIEVWTTCARDHRTWENELPSGRTVENFIPVLRFPVDERDLETFIRSELAMRDGQVLTVEEQLDWLQSGVNSKALYEHIATHAHEFDALLFAPYLFPTTFWGAMIAPERSIIIPCLHDEHYAYQGVFRTLFHSVRGLLFNAAPEMELCREICGVDEGRGGVVGMGFDDTLTTSCSPRMPERPYLLYCGRKEQGKNLDLLIQYFEEYCRGDLEASEQKPLLVIIGSGEIHFRETLPEGVLDFGFASEEEKRQLMRGALALVQPSVNESF